MSIDIIKEQINRFLSSGTPEVMAIKGKWGVGKTYSWNKFLKEAKDADRINLKKYSYVSLFGINSLDSLKYEIFEKVIGCNLIGTNANLETFKNHSTDFVKTTLKKGLDLTKFKSTTHVIESLAFLSLNETIICIDDLERKGKSLEIKDVLGLVSLLKEQKKCKVIFLLNDGEDGLEDYEKYREKVIDFELEFSPTAEECAHIAFADTSLDGYTSQILKESTVKLNIKNIRILKKIERLILLTAAYLKDYENEITHQVVHSLTLFSWCYYCERSEDVPTLDFVTNLERSFFGIEFEEGDSDKHKKWKTTVYEYGYRMTDEFDSLLSKAVRTGYFVETEFKEKASKKNKEVIASKSAQSFYDAWNLYRDSFDDNQSEVVNSIYENFKKYTKFIEPHSLESTVSLFRELGEDDKAEELIDLYISDRKEESELFNPDGFSFFCGLKDQSIIDKFSATYQASVVSESAEQILERIAGKDGWNPEDLIVLSNTAVSQYCEIFKGVRAGDQRRSFVKTCLQFGQVQDSNCKHIAITATDALKLIAKESSINKLRVKGYGVQLDD